VLGISTNSNELALKLFRRTFKVEYPLLMADGEAARKLFAQYDITDGIVPTTVLVDRQSRIRKHYIGTTAMEAFTTDIEDLLKMGATK
jgi:peroxiredoxin